MVNCDLNLAAASSSRGEMKNMCRLSSADDFTSMYCMVPSAYLQDSGWKEGAGERAGVVDYDDNDDDNGYTQAGPNRSTAR
jgi:hypothetical protein